MAETKSGVGPLAGGVLAVISGAAIWIMVQHSIERAGSYGQGQEATSPVAPAISVPVPAATVRAPSVPLVLVRNDDQLTPVKSQRVRHFAAEGYPAPADLRAELLAQFEILRVDASGSVRPNRLATVFVYPSTRRAAAGRGEWIGMAQAKALDGKPFPYAPETITVRAPAVDAVPSPRDEELYDELMDALAADPNDGPGGEAAVKRRLAKGLGVKVAEVDAAYRKVAAVLFSQPQ